MLKLTELFPDVLLCSLFDGVSKESIDTFLDENSFTVEHFSSGDILYSPKSKKVCVGLILSGSAVAISGADRSILKDMRAHDVFGVSNLYSKNNFPSTIVAKTQCSMIMFDGESFKRFIENDPLLRKNYLEFLTEKIMYLNKKISNLLVGSVERRVASHIIENQSGGIYEPSSSISSLANMLGIGRASLYRALDSLEDLALIKKESKKISIPDIDALIDFIK